MNDQRARRLHLWMERLRYRNVRDLSFKLVPGMRRKQVVSAIINESYDGSAIVAVLFFKE